MTGSQEEIDRLRRALEALVAAGWSFVGAGKIESGMGARFVCGAHHCEEFKSALEKARGAP
jgi:hypothetical protein